MSTAPVFITTTDRHVQGSTPCRALRHQHFVPGIVYGLNKDNQVISVDAKELTRQTQVAGFFSRLFTLKFDNEEQDVLAKDLQVHPVTDKILHVDFMRVDKTKAVNVYVPLRFINEDKSPAIKRGGTLNVVSHQLEVTCPPSHIPAYLEIDLSTIQTSLTLDALTLPEQVVAAHPTRDHTLATIVGGGATAAAAE